VLASEPFSYQDESFQQTHFINWFFSKIAHLISIIYV